VLGAEPRERWIISSVTGVCIFRWDSKQAIGAMGGYVCGSRDLIDFLYLRARPFLIFHFPSPATAAACQAAFALLDSPEGEKLVKKLWANTKMFKRELKKRGFQFKVSETPIFPSTSRCSAGIRILEEAF